MLLLTYCILHIIHLAHIKFSEKETFLTPKCGFQGVRNVSFSVNFVHEQLNFQ